MLYKEPSAKEMATCEAIMTIVRPIITVMQWGSKTGLIASSRVPGRFTVYIGDDSSYGTEKKGVKTCGRNGEAGFQ